MHKQRTKMKTHKGAAKRFRMTASGKINRAKAFKSHILTKKGSKRKRHLRAGDVVSDGDRENVKKMLPYA